MNLNEMNQEQLHELKVRMVDFFVDNILPVEFAKVENISIEEATEVVHEFKKLNCYTVV